jgi:hypothetical protein
MSSMRSSRRSLETWLGPAALAASSLALGVVPLLTATSASAEPPPAPTTFFGLPIPSGLPTALPPYVTQRVSGLPALPALPGMNEPINMQVLTQLLTSKANGCGANEVAPGEYVKLDCRPYAQVLSAVRDVFDPAKLDLLSRGQLHVTPQAPVPAPQGGKEGIPGEIDHRTMGLEGPVKDQGLVGDCSAFSLSSVIDNAILRMHHSDVISPEHLWAHYGNSDMGSAGDTNLQKMIALNQTWPYSAKQACELVRDPTDECGQLLGVTPNSAPSDAVLQGQYRQAEASGAYKITSIDRVTSKPNIRVDAIVAILASGADVWAGFDVDVASWKSTSQVNNVIRDWPTPNAGHAVALAGYRTTPGGTDHQFLVHNSWGGRWGDHGYAWVSENMVRQHLQVAYKVTVVDPRTPGASKGGAQTDDECGAGSLVDMLTGACAPACPGGGRRAAGQCLPGR